MLIFWWWSHKFWSWKQNKKCRVSTSDSDSLNFPSTTKLWSRAGKHKTGLITNLMLEFWFHGQFLSICKSKVQNKFNFTVSILLLNT